MLEDYFEKFTHLVNFEMINANDFEYSVIKKGTNINKMLHLKNIMLNTARLFTPMYNDEK